MEEQGIGGIRHRGCGSLSRSLARTARAICLALAFTTIPAVRAGSIEADITIAGYDLAVGQSFVSRILLYPSEPGDSSLAIENVPASFTPRASRKERRSLGALSDSSPERIPATLFEGEWVVTEAGTYTVGPFVLRSKDEELVLPAISVTVTEPLSGEYRYLGWAVGGDGDAGSPPVVGKKTRLRLEASFPGELTAVVCPATERALLETSYLALPGFRPGDEREIATVGEFDWTPLVAGTVRLPSASVDFRSRDGSVARIFVAERSLTVSPSSRDRGDSGDSGDRGGTETSVYADVTAAFRETPSARDAAAENPGGSHPPLVDLPTEDPVFREVSRLWKSKYTGRALAELRRAEYRSLFPFDYSSARRAAELSIGIESSLSVPPAAWKPVSVIGAVILACLAFASRLVALSMPSRSRALRVPFAVALLLSAALVSFAAYAYSSDLREAAVVVSGELKRVPEDDSRVVGVLKPGDAVRVYGRSDEWLFVRNAEAIEGWLRVDQVVFYSGGTKP